MKSLISYFKNVKMELAHVQFPTGKETILFSTLVVFLSVALGYFLGAVDLGFISALKIFLA